MKILIAEDNPIIQRVHQSAMTMSGYEYDLVDNGRDAVDLARINAGCYDLALLDVEMPVMDGIEAARLIRRSVRYFPIAALSSDPDYLHRCLEVGIDVFIKKPRSPVEMLQDICLLASKRYGHLEYPD